MQTPVAPPRPELLLGPLLASLPTASVSPQPPAALLPLLSPILRQRVQLLSEGTTDPWLSLLCYDPAKASKLEAVVKNERLEPHPVSGEVEIDWEDEVDVHYRRIDDETFQSLATMQDLGLSVRLVWCTNDEAGGSDGWRIGEVGVTDSKESSWGFKTISEAESVFKTTSSNSLQARTFPPTNGRLPTPDAENQGEDDDDYWAQYDNTPARTPGLERAPNPDATAATDANGLGPRDGTEEDAYFSQYASVQPAMDSHDPDEAQQNGDVETSLGRGEVATELQSHIASHGHDGKPGEFPSASNDFNSSFLAAAAYEAPQPRSTSSHGSPRSDTVTRLERLAEEEIGARNLNETGIKQHIGTSIKSLWRLAKVGGIEQEEFARIVQRELDVLSIVEDHSE